MTTDSNTYSQKGQRNWDRICRPKQTILNSHCFHKSRRMFNDLTFSYKLGRIKILMQLFFKMDSKLLFRERNFFWKNLYNYFK